MDSHDTESTVRAGGFRAPERSPVAVAGMAICLAAAGCQRPPEPEPEPLPVLLNVPEAYWTEAEGTISLGDMDVPGIVRIHYLVNPDSSVLIPHFSVWMDDRDLSVTFLWWEVDRVPLRCTVFRNARGIEANLEGGELVVPAGTQILGHAFPERGSDGSCRGKPRLLDAESPAELRAVHDPEGDRFSISGSFDASYEGNAYVVSLAAEGRFLNRPPVAALEVVGEGVSVGEDGCPATEKGQPPIAMANNDEGLEVSFRSSSYDPDGRWVPGQDPKLLRVDIAFEQWGRTRPEGWTFLSRERDVGPLLFETGREHQLLLWISDRKGAEGRKLCHFQVVEPG